MSKIVIGEAVRITQKKEMDPAFLVGLGEGRREGAQLLSWGDVVGRNHGRALVVDHKKTASTHNVGRSVSRVGASCGSL